MDLYAVLGWMAAGVAALAGILAAWSLIAGDDGDVLVGRLFPCVLGVLLAIALLSLGGEL